MMRQDDQGERFRAEYERVRRYLEDAIAELAAENGHLQYFSAILTRSAFELHAEVFGIEGLEKMMSGIATRQLLAERGIQKC
jgi:hypothetical protein